MIQEEKDVNDQRCDLTDRGLKSTTSTFHTNQLATSELTNNFSKFQITKDFDSKNKSESSLGSPILLPNPQDDMQSQNLELIKDSRHQFAQISKDTQKLNEPTNS